MVRSFASRFYRPPWPFIKKGSMGQRKIGPMHFEKHKWPGQNREFPELSPKFQKNNMPELRGYTGVQLMGYTDPVSGKFVCVKEMIPELIVPDLSGFELKPYVSYRTDVEIEKRNNKYTELVTNKGSEAAADLLTVEAERWPPPKMTAQTLFDLFYAEKVQDSFIALKSQKGDSATSKSSSNSNKGLLNGLKRFLFNEL